MAGLDGAVLMSVVTRVELEGGVYRDSVDAPIARARLDVVLSAIPALAFDDAAADVYRTIVERAGYSRRKVLDRMIATRAIVHRATVVTMNPDDFADIDRLSMLAWCGLGTVSGLRLQGQLLLGHERGRTFQSCGDRVEVAARTQ
ncbi:PIN domain-containing protein [Gemmatimonas groenlandica]|uniref:PIN domain-containing protein n=1 Tax=Gemmatimonas groenlandica TaxID=2732249 RepID=UPI0019804CEE